MRLVQRTERPHLVRRQATKAERLRASIERRAHRLMERSPPPPTRTGDWHVVVPYTELLAIWDSAERMRWEIRREEPEK